MKDLNDRTQELLSGFRESGYCTECWANLNEGPHEPECPTPYLRICVSSEEIAKALVEEHAQGIAWATWEHYHPLVLSVLRWLDERNYLTIADPPTEEER